MHQIPCIAGTGPDFLCGACNTVVTTTCTQRRRQYEFFLQGIYSINLYLEDLCLRLADLLSILFSQYTYQYFNPDTLSLAPSLLQRQMSPSALLHGLWEPRHLSPHAQQEVHQVHLSDLSGICWIRWIRWIRWMLHLSSSC